RWVVGVGMAPRGEVGLIFAALGLTAGLIATWQYTALLLVVMATTFVTPLWLQRLSGSFAGELDLEGMKNRDRIAKDTEP
ncbi:MAG TPA: cation:proton antiporter, partial [Candidatus Thermoplasmatota archaeon]|nr:cation:proton antiporter [Candidatus Thermoplasmatota archaeon]